MVAEDVPDGWPIDRAVAALRDGRRVIVEAEGPIDGPAGSIWRRLPKQARRRLTLATWAFADSGIFDLLAMPRLTGIDPDDPGVLVLRRESDVQEVAGPAPMVESGPGRSDAVSAVEGDS